MSSRLAFRLACLAALLLVGAVAVAGERPLTVETHCEATKRLLRLYESEWRERIAAAETNRGNSASLQRALATIAARHRALREAACGELQTTQQALAEFSRDHAVEIADYLDSHRDDQADIAAAHRRIRLLTDRFESLMEEDRRGRK